MSLNPAFRVAVSGPSWEYPKTPEELVEIRRILERDAVALAGPVEVDDAMAVFDLLVPGEVDIPIRVYRPDGAPHTQLVVYVHGGGWVVGSRDSYDSVCRQFAGSSGQFLVSVEYRLSPEAPFPAALDDIAQVLAWARESNVLADTGFSRVCLVGDSAGGNLVAATTVRESRLGYPPHGQVLVYPALDACTRSDSYKEFAEGYGLTAADMAWFWSQYLQGDSLAKDPLVSPLLSEEEVAWPPTLILSAECDVLRDEAEEMVKLIQSGGTEVLGLRALGMPHGFLTMGSLSRDVSTYIRMLATWVRLILEMPLDSVD